MKSKTLYKIFIYGFSLLYLLVSAISLIHALEFFNIGNSKIMSGMLAFAFEGGLMLSLLAILLSDKNKKAYLPWILMIVLTAVQVIGNVYSTFKYISLSEVDYYVYLQKPLLFWLEEVSQDTVQVIVSWIIGALLPIVALCMTDMVASNIRNMITENDDIDLKDVGFSPTSENVLGETKEVKEETKEEYIAPEVKVVEQEPVVEEQEEYIPEVEEVKEFFKKEPIETNAKEDDLESDFYPAHIPEDMKETDENKASGDDFHKAEVTNNDSVIFSSGVIDASLDESDDNIVDYIDDEMFNRVKEEPETPNIGIKNIKVRNMMDKKREVVADEIYPLPLKRDKK